MNLYESYNKHCKDILSRKLYLALIMKYCIDEYKNYGIDTIIGCIEDGNDSTKVKGLMNDFDDIRFDVFYKAKLPDGDGVLINVEAQKTSKVEYSLINRALVYIGYGFVYQYNRIFKNQQYDKLHKVVSIWICFDAPTKKEENSLTEVLFFRKEKIGYNRIVKKDYDKGSIVIIYLGKTRYKDGLLRFLEVLFSNELTVQDKACIFENEYHIRLDNEMRGELDTMCNLAEGIKEMGIEQGKKEGMFIAIVNLMRNLSLSFDEAIQVIDMPNELVDKCREYVYNATNL